MLMSPIWHSSTDFLGMVSLLGETYDYFATACSFLHLIFTLEFLRNFYTKVGVDK